MTPSFPTLKNRSNNVGEEKPSPAVAKISYHIRRSKENSKSGNPCWELRQTEKIKNQTSIDDTATFNTYE